MHSRGIARQALMTAAYAIWAAALRTERKQGVCGGLLQTLGAERNRKSAAGRTAHRKYSMQEIPENISHREKRRAPLRMLCEMFRSVFKRFRLVGAFPRGQRIKIRAPHVPVSRKTSVLRLEQVKIANYRGRPEIEIITEDACDIFILYFAGA